MSEEETRKNRTVAAPEPHPEEDKLMPHSYDGIREYDKRLPNWWLWTFYLAMIFSFGYWFVVHRSEPLTPPEVELERKVAEMAMKASAGGDLSDDQLWQMAENPDIVAAGNETFQTTCASCHGPNLGGGIGFNLADAEWVHGVQPNDIMKTVSEGIVEKGMPEWGPVIGAQRVAEVTAFVLSYHTPGPQGGAVPR